MRVKRTMTQRGDGPTTRRMGFGYGQARAAGAPLPRPERSATAINAERIVKKVKSLTLNYNLYGIGAYHPNPDETALRLARRGYPAVDIIWTLKADADKKRPT